MMSDPSMTQFVDVTNKRLFMGPIIRKGYLVDGQSNLLWDVYRGKGPSTLHAICHCYETPPLQNSSRFDSYEGEERRPHD